jgi:hypothetical protein
MSPFLKAGNRELRKVKGEMRLRRKHKSRTSDLLRSKPREWHNFSADQMKEELEENSDAWVFRSSSEDESRESTATSR